VTTQITALYVYATTTLETANPIEPITGGKLGPGTVTLKPGIYRVLANPKLTAILEAAAKNVANAANAADPTYEHQTFTKGDSPDPPDRSLQKLATPKGTIVQFMGGAGEADDVDDLDDEGEHNEVEDIDIPEHLGGQKPGKK